MNAPLANRTSVADPERVRKMFGAIARRYDLANHLLSCGCDFYWRKRAADVVAAWHRVASASAAASTHAPPSLTGLTGQSRLADFRVVDLATGTGDLALALQRKIPNAKIIGADFSEKMLAIAESKGVRETILANAMQLPFEDASLDAITIAFGLRNFPDWSGALREMRRVLRGDAHVLILEFSLPTMSILRGLYRFYLHRVVPLIGAGLTKEKGAYDYLGDSIEEFPNGEAMLRLLEANGFRNATAERLSGGIVSIYTAQRPLL